MFYYPNRPILSSADPDNPMNPGPKLLRSLEREERYVAEQKWNGDNVMIYPDTMTFLNRQGSPMRYQPSPQVIKEFKNFPKGCIINGELMHYKTKEIKNKIILHCVMAWKGKPLFGKTWGDSRKILDAIPDGESVTVSRVWRKGFWKLYKEADGKVIEGIILKDPKGSLVFSTTPIPDVPWMRKFRVPSKKYNF